MDAFEELVSGILRADGYWVERSVRVELSADDKRALDNYSMPRPEIDLVAYKPAAGKLLAIECKSYFDSGGIHFRDLAGGRNAQRYKMFVNAALRDLVLARLVDQLVDAHMIMPDTRPRLMLAYGHATAHNEALLQGHFEQNGWLLLGPAEIRAKVAAMAVVPYDNQVASVVAKLLSSGGGQRRSPVSRRRLSHATQGEAACQ